MDCTSSMDIWIRVVKNQIKKIVQDALDKSEKQNLIPRVSFVGYRDITDRVRFEICGFNENLEEIVEFVSRIRAE